MSLFLVIRCCNQFLIDAGLFQAHPLITDRYTKCRNRSILPATGLPYFYRTKGRSIYFKLSKERVEGGARQQPEKQINFCSKI
jgi:hypothetical protein